MVAMEGLLSRVQEPFFSNEIFQMSSHPFHDSTGRAIERVHNPPVGQARPGHRPQQHLRPPDLLA